MENYITRKPKLSDYGLDKQTVISLKSERDEYLKKRENGFSFEKHPLSCVLLACFPLFLFTMILNFLGHAIGGSFVEEINNPSVEFNVLAMIILCFGSFISIRVFKMPANQSYSTFVNSFPRKKEWDNYLRYKEDTRKYNNWLESKKIEFWNSLDGFSFEKEMQKLFAAQGYDSSLTNAGADGGVDIVLKKGGKTIAVQCKAHKTKISEGIARDLYGVLFAHNYDGGILATVNGASKKTIEFCNGLRDKPIKIIDVKDIIKMQENLQYRSRE